MNHAEMPRNSKRRQTHPLIERLEDRRLLAAAANELLWKYSSAPPVFAADGPKPAAYRAFSLDRNLLAPTLESARLEFSLGPVEPAHLRPGRLRGELRLPTPDGELAEFRLVETQIMDTALARKLTGVATYSGISSDGDSSVRVTVTPEGLHAKVRSSQGDYIVNPVIGDPRATYMSYFESDLAAAPGDIFDHDDHDEHDGGPLVVGGLVVGGLVVGGQVVGGQGEAELPVGAPPPIQTTGPELRTYRLAVAATGEFTARHGGTVASAQAKIVEAINDANDLYERELGIRFLLIDNSSIVYVDAQTDPYTNSSRSAMQTENQSNLDAVIGDANYDIGHVFATSGGGRASIGVAGRPGVKARAVSANNLNFSTLTVSHEIGHQFSSRHTWNGANGSCSAGQWNADFSMEPGSGSTIMSYGGFCGIDNVVTTRDTYFHSVTYDAIINYVTTRIPSVGNITPTGNTAPIVDAGEDYTIPAATPFQLDAVAAIDSEGDTVFSNWEQRDLGAGQKALAAPDDGLGPLFRSYPKSTQPVRTLPRLTELLNNTLPKGEQLPTTNRTINFRLNANDGRGGTASDQMAVTVVDTGDAFAVTSPNTAVDWPAFSTQAITWDVAGTDANGIDVATVHILISYDGGTTFDTVLASDVANDGSHDVVIPESLTTNARIKIQPVGNIFFDISDADFTIIAPTSVNVATVQINDGNDQRSQVTSLTISFDGDTNVSSNAFEIRNRLDASTVPISTGLTTVDDKTVATITFLPGNHVMTRAAGNSLVDGNYQLQIFAAEVEKMQTDFRYGETSADAFFRLFGDTDGDRDVDGQDFGRLGLTFLKPPLDPAFNEVLDADGDNDVDGQDYGRFDLRFLRSLPF